uniref:PDEase domain-containing protein n=1 Tax=Syphacia muris TaxID=451379 RepID=A0A0N5AWU6_9BILA
MHVQSVSSPCLGTSPTDIPVLHRETTVFQNSFIMDKDDVDDDGPPILTRLFEYLRVFYCIVSFVAEEMAIIPKNAYHWLQNLSMEQNEQYYPETSRSSQKQIFFRMNQEDALYSSMLISCADISTLLHVQINPSSMNPVSVYENCYTIYKLYWPYATSVI